MAKKLMYIKINGKYDFQEKKRPINENDKTPFSI